MTPQEFKAWFDGFTEAFENRVPTKAQWKRVQERVAEIDGKPVTERIYVDRYLPSCPSYYPFYPITTITPVYRLSTGPVGVASSGTLTNCSSNVVTSFNSLAAMNDLGRAEASNMGAA